MNMDLLGGYIQKEEEEKPHDGPSKPESGREPKKTRKNISPADISPPDTSSFEDEEEEEFTLTRAEKEKFTFTRAEKKQSAKKYEPT